MTSTFVSYLKKIGKVLVAGLELVGFISPAILPLLGSSKTGVLIGKVTNDFTAIGTTVIQIETALQGKPGIEKLQAASALVAPIVRTSELVSGHTVKNESEFIAGCTDLTNAVVRIMNALDSNNINTAGSPVNVTAAPLATPTPAV